MALIKYVTTVLFCAVASVPAMAGIVLPPINWGGSLGSTYGLSLPGVGGVSTAVGNTLGLQAGSFIWRPWFATWNGSVSLLRSTTETDSSESTSDLISGSSSVSLFPRSHFPAQLTFSFSDSDADNATSNGFDTRLSISGITTTRFGVAQQVRPKDLPGRYNWRASRAITSDKITGNESISDLVKLGAKHSTEKHHFSGSLLVRNLKNGVGDTNNFEILSSGDHRYRHDEQLSIESRVGLSYREVMRAGVTQSALANLGLDGSLSWRDLERPLTVNANANFSASADVLGAGSVRQTLGVSGSASYRFTLTPQLTGSLSLGLGLGISPSTTSITTGQSASIAYSPEEFDLMGLSYNWMTSGSIRNQTNSDSGPTGGLSGTVGHRINKIHNLNRTGSLRLSFSAAQNLSVTYPFAGVETMTLTHTSSVNVRHQFPGGGSSLSAALSQISVVAEGVAQVMAFSLSAAHNRNLGRYMSLSSDLVIGQTRSSTDSDRFEASFSKFSVSFNHQRLFRINRLRLKSSLDMRSDGLNPFDPNAPAASLGWRTNFNYSIGRLSTSVSANLSKAGDAPADKSIFISTTRSF